MATINLTASGSSTISYSGNESTIAIYGTFGGGNVKAEVSFDNGVNWIQLVDVGRNSISSITTNAMYNIKIAGAGCKMKFTLAGATNPDVYITI